MELLARDTKIALTIELNLRLRRSVHSSRFVGSRTDACAGNDSEEDIPAYSLS